MNNNIKDKNIRNNVRHGRTFIKVSLYSFVALLVVNIVIEKIQHVKLGNITNAIIGLSIFIAFLNIEYDFIGVSRLEK
jgi:hypothetical protein